jgi:primosomal protein N' (replication factor Y)
MASVSGPAAAVDDLLAVVRLPGDAEVLGPLPAASRAPGRPTVGAEAAGPAGDDDGSVPDAVRYLVRVPRSEGTELALALRAAQAVRTAAKAPGAVRVQLDPAALI